MSLPPLHGVTPTDQGGADLIVCYVLIVTTASVSLARYVVGRQRLLRVDLDDVTFAGAVVFAILTSVITHKMVDNGLGQHQNALSDDEVTRFFKYSYSDMFLAITATTFAKFSILLLFRRIMSQSRAVQAFITLSVFIGLYFVFSIFANAFQCGATRPWILNPDRCPTHGGLQYGIIGFNMLTDIMLAVWILPSLWKLQMSVQNRIVVMSLFGARIVVPGVAIGQIVLLHRSLQSEDQTWTQLPLTIIHQVVVHLSVIHATLPRIHGFLSKLQTGMLVTRVATTMPQGSKENSKASGRRASGGYGVNTIGSTDRGKRKVDGRLYVSSSSYDYPLPDDSKMNGGYGAPMDLDSIHPITEEADGNFTDGLRLRPDIPPGSKWSTTIYSDHDSNHEMPRQHSSSTKGDDALQMGTRPDEENSQSSIYEDHYGSPAAAGAGTGPSGGAPPVPGVPSHIWKTKEFRMQVEKMQDGNLVDVTKRENRKGRGREMTEVA